METPPRHLRKQTRSRPFGLHRPLSDATGATYNSEINCDVHFGNRLRLAVRTPNASSPALHAKENTLDPRRVESKEMCSNMVAHIAGTPRITFSLPPPGGFTLDLVSDGYFRQRELRVRGS